MSLTEDQLADFALSRTADEAELLLPTVYSTLKRHEQSPSTPYTVSTGTTPPTRAAFVHWLQGLPKIERFDAPAKPKENASKQAISSYESKRKAHKTSRDNLRKQFRVLCSLAATLEARLSESTEDGESE